MGYNLELRYAAAQKPRQQGTQRTGNHQNRDLPLLLALFGGLRRLLQQCFSQSGFKSTGVATPCGNRLHQDLFQLWVEGYQL